MSNAIPYQNQPFYAPYDASNFEIGAILESHQESKHPNVLITTQTSIIIFLTQKPNPILRVYRFKLISVKIANLQIFWMVEN